MAELFANNFATQLTVGCAPTDNVIHVASAAPDALQGGQFRVLIDSEYMLVAGGQSGTDWTVTRGAGTGESPIPVPDTHFQGSWVTHLWTAAAVRGFAGAVAVQGAPSANLGSAQTIDFAGEVQEIWLVGTLNANLTVTTINRTAGARATLLLTQGAAGANTLTVSDGGSTAGVTIAAAPGATSLVGIQCPDSSTTVVEVVVTQSAGSSGITDLGNVTSTVTLNLAGSVAHTFTFTLTAPTCAISLIGAIAGSEVIVIPYQDGSPPRLVTHPAAVAWTSTGPPTLSSNANAPDRFQYTVLAVDGSGNPTRIVGSLGFTSGAAPQPIDPPVIT